MVPFSIRAFFFKRVVAAGGTDSHNKWVPVLSTKHSFRPATSSELFGGGENRKERMRRCNVVLCTCYNRFQMRWQINWALQIILRPGIRNIRRNIECGDRLTIRFVQSSNND